MAAIESWFNLAPIPWPMGELTRLVFTCGFSDRGTTTTPYLRGTQSDGSVQGSSRDGSSRPGRNPEPSGVTQAKQIYVGKDERAIRCSRLLLPIQKY